MRKTGWRWLWVSVIILILDRISKYLVFHYLTASTSVLPFFNISLGLNKGVAFSFLDSSTGEWQTPLLSTLAVLVCLGLLVWLKQLPAQKRWNSIAISLIIGGALGNVWDRLMYGYVIDFLDFYIKNWHWPAFNVADSAVCIGAIMLMIDALWAHKKTEQNQR